MCECVRECVREASWRLKSVVGTRRYHTDGELIQHFKAHVLSYVEYRTPGLYHAASTILEPLNRILRSFLRDVNVGLEDALLYFNLAPLETRRDIAMLGFIHRALLQQGPVQFQQWFVLDSSPSRPQRHSRNFSSC